MNFAEAAKQKSNFTRTENGAVALNTSGSKLLDLFSTIGSLRNTDNTRIERLFADAYNEDSLMATKIAFYGRDIREGLGERETFRILLKYMAQYHPEALRPNLDKIGEYGRYDDWYCLIGTSLEYDMWAVMKEQFEEDLKKLNSDEPISLLAKWIKTADASSDATRELGIQTALHLGYKVYNFKRIVRTMRKKIKVTEALMSTNQWDKIDYSAVPSRSMLLHKDAFAKHDSARFSDFVSKAVSGETKINSSTLYPYDLVEKILYSNEDNDVMEAQWKQLPNYVEPGTNAIVMADTSGSMWGRPLASAVGLAIYFAERNTGAYHNLWMNFSDEPKMQTLKGEKLYQKIHAIEKTNWGWNTNLHAAFKLILKIAEDNDVSQEDMPKSIIVISDMEIDHCGDREWSFYDKMAAKFDEKGYEIPNIIFWNVDSRHDVFHADSTRKGVQLVSGQSASTFKQLMGCVGMTPIEMMEHVINSERYDPITVER